MKNGPCYRCLFPQPPPPETVGNCSDNGVIGVVPGIIGCIQALEVIKIITKKGDVLSQKLLLFDGFTTQFKNVKLRGRNPNCSVCGDNPTILSLINYEQFCGTGANDKVILKDTLPDKDLHISCNEYKNILNNGIDHILLDVRSTIQYQICSLPNSWNIPLSKIKENKDEIVSKMHENGEDSIPIYVICRRGIASQKAVKLLYEEFGIKNIKNIWGGLTLWSQEVDLDFPMY